MTSLPSDRRCGALLGALALAALTGCGGALTPEWEQLLSHCPTVGEIGRLEARDRIEIRVRGEEELSGEYEISPAGTITFPLLHAVEVVGLRCDEVAARLTEQLGARYLRNPDVTCLTKSAHRMAVTIEGAVVNAGVVEYTNGLRLIDAIAESGGLTVHANGDVVIQRRQEDGRVMPIVVPYYDIAAGNRTNVCLHPGDVLYVREAAL